MDERFADLLTNPKFRRIRKQDRKVKVDERFQSLIKSTKSRSHCTIDKRGRPLQASKNDLHQFYDLSDLEDEEKDEKVVSEKRMTKTKIGENKKKKVNRNKKSSVVEKSEEETDGSEEDGIGHEDDESKEEEEDESEEDDSEEDESEEDENDVDESEEEEEDEVDGSEEDKSEDDKGKEHEIRSRKEGNKVKKKKKKKKERIPDYSRGIGNESSSEEDEEQKSDSDDDPETEDGAAKDDIVLAATIHPWADQTEPEIPTVEESSRRLAICNMNWDYINAQDLMLLCNSFKPQHGTVISVTIYPTDFGLERMKGETMKGPKELVDSEEQTKKNPLQTKNKKNKAMDAEQLRQYELNRLRYFVAVVECDSVETADHIYRSCDGMEFEKTGTKVDMRYIPDDVTFDHEPKSMTSSLPASGTYKPPRFVDSALSKTDVKLSWDKTSHRRLAVTQVDLRKVKNVDEMEEQMKEYLAPYSSEEEEKEDDDDDNEKDADPYAGLDWSYVPEYIPEKRDVDELKRLLLEPEVSKEKDEDDIDMEITWEIGLKDDLEEAAKEKQKQMKLGKMTPFEQYKQKRKEKQRLKEREKRQSKRKNEKEERNTVGDGMDLETFFIGDDDDEQSDIKKESSSGKTDEQNNSNKIKSRDSLKKRAKKRKQEMAERLEVDKVILSDPRFADLASKDFAIDPSAPEFHKRRRKL